MAENLLKTAGGKSGGAGEDCKSNKEVIGLNLDILGKNLDLHIEVGKGRIRLADIVPLARILCTQITDIAIEYIRSNGEQIQCRKGCASCCARYLIPLSVPEALRLREEVSKAPKARRELILEACLFTAKRILSHTPPKLSKNQAAETSFVGHIDLNRLSNWYKSLKLPCPFLHKDLCTIYQNRPLACREYFVKGPFEACKAQQSVADVVKMPVQMPNVLAQLASELEGTGTEAVILPLTFLWYEQNRYRAGKSWPAVKVVKRFIEIVRAMVLKNSISVVATENSSHSKTPQAVVSL